MLRRLRQLFARRVKCEHEWVPDFWGQITDLPGGPIYGVVDVCSKGCGETLVRFP